MRINEYGETLYPVTLDETRAKPTLVFDDGIRKDRAFKTTDDAHNWAGRHHYYVADYIIWEV